MTYNIGNRVVIVGVAGQSFKETNLICKDPSPEHIGKCGKITQLGDLEKDLELLIELEDGTIIKGCDCWWKRLARGW